MEKSRFFSELAGEWEACHSRVDERAELARLAQFFSLKPGDRVLDAGCGTGRLLPFLRSAVGLQGWIAELDFSAEMLRIGRMKTPAESAGYVRADSERLPFRSAAFDAVICFALFPHLDHPEAAAAEFRRVLVPGGRVFIAHLMSREDLNRMHGTTSGPVKHDLLLDAAAMTRILESGGLASIRIIDRPGLYLAEARRPAL